MSAILAKLQLRWKAIGELQNEGVICKGNVNFKNLVDTRVRLRKLSKSETDDFFRTAMNISCPDAPMKEKKVYKIDKRDIVCRNLF